MALVPDRSGIRPSRPESPGGGTLGAVSSEARPEPDEATIAADLVRRITAGDPLAESQLVERYRRALLCLLQHLGALPDQAEDLQQETFQIVIERVRREGLADPAGLGTFLRGTARNLYANARRKTVRRRTWGDAGELAQAPTASPSQLQSLLLEEEAAIVRRLIGELHNERDQQLLLRFYLGEEDKESICADLGLDHLHFNRVLFRARQRFKELMERFEKRQALARNR